MSEGFGGGGDGGEEGGGKAVEVALAQAEFCAQHDESGNTCSSSRRRSSSSISDCTQAHGFGLCTRARRRLLVCVGSACCVWVVVCDESNDEDVFVFVLRM